MNNSESSSGCGRANCRRSALHRLLALFLLAGAVFNMGAFAAVPKVLGGIELQSEVRGSATPIATTAPIYVADFSLAVVEEPPAGPLARLAQRLPRSSASDAQKQAREIVERMSTEIVEGFKQRGVVAQRASADKLPNSGWIIQGMFTEVGEGNRIRHAIIGFGSGASSMDVQVMVSDLAGSQPRQPFFVLSTEKNPSKMPGALVTKNAYVAVAKLVIAKNAPRKDVRQTAEAIVEHVLKYRQQSTQ